MQRLFQALVATVLTLILWPHVYGQFQVSDYTKISDTVGGFEGELEDKDYFSTAIANAGDVDGDGLNDLAVGVRHDDDGGVRRGAVWILFLDSDGSVIDEQKISDTQGDFDGELHDYANFGMSIAGIGDLDGDGVPDLAVGSPGDIEGTDDGDGNPLDPGTAGSGAVWILFLNDDGTVKEHEKISDRPESLDGELGNTDSFGFSVAPVDDYDGDGVVDLLVGAPFTNVEGTGGVIETEQAGVVWLFLLNDDGTFGDYYDIGTDRGDFTGELDEFDNFGRAVACPGDVDDDGTLDFIVGAPKDDDGTVLDPLNGYNRGALWVLFMNDDGTVRAHQKISDTEGDLGANLEGGDQIGRALSAIGDVDDDGVVDILVGSNDDDGGSNLGGVRFLLLNDDGTVKEHHRISDSNGNFGGILERKDFFGHSVTSLGDHNADGVIDIAVGADRDDDGNEDDDRADRGAVYVLFLGSEILRGDVDGSGEVVALVDALALLEWRFADGEAPQCDDAADVNDSGAVQGLVDPMSLLQWGFADGPMPSDPGVSECGPDPTYDEISCAQSACP